MIVTLGQQSPLFDGDKICELFKIKDWKAWKSSPSSYAINQVQENIMTLNRFDNISKPHIYAYIKMIPIYNHMHT